ncbi:MAG: hypothetical protein J6B87_02840 [Clostridia bacterium]|nr:hypothetical protein [Clostridia bacterium]
MKTTNFKIEERKLNKLNSVPYMGELNVDTFHFEFDEEWIGLEKTLVIIAEGKTYNVALLNDEAVLPTEAYIDNKSINIGVFGKKDNTILSTNLIDIWITKGAYAEGQEPSNLPTPTQWDLYIAEINRLLDEANASKEECERILEEMTELKEKVEKAEQGVDAFNKNATEKTNQFDKNAADWKNTINKAGQDNLEAVNSAGTQQVKDINTAGTKAIKSIETAETEAINKIQTEGESYDARITKLETKVDQTQAILPTQTASGENVYIDNAQSYPLIGLSGDGKCEQVTTTGKQLLPITATTKTVNGITFKINDDKSITISGTSTAKATINLDMTERTLNTGSYTMSTGISKISGLSLGTQIDSTYYVAETSKLIELSANATFKKWYIDVESGKTVNTTIYPMFEAGTEATAYEPYTGGQASPNPDYPQEITTIEEAEYKGVGKNLFKILSPLKEVTNKDVKLTIGDDNIITLNGTATGDWWPDFIYNIASNTVAHEKVITNLAKDYYTFSAKVISGTASKLTATCVFNDEIEKETTALSLTKLVSTTPKEVYGINRIYFYIANGAVFSDFKIQFQLEKGTEATAYEPYQESTLPIDLQGNELCKVGDVADKLLIDRKGNVAIEKNVSKVVLNGSENDWSVASVKDITKVFALPGFDYRAKANTKVLTDYFIYNQAGDTEKIILDTYTHWIYVAIKKSTASTVEDFKTWLSENNVTIYYELKTPEIINLGTVENPEIFKGINNIVVETNLGNMNVEIEYVEDLQARLEKVEQAIISLGGI